MVFDSKLFALGIAVEILFIAGWRIKRLQRKARPNAQIPFNKSREEIFKLMSLIRKLFRTNYA